MRAVPGLSSVATRPQGWWLCWSETPRPRDRGRVLSLDSRLPASFTDTASDGRGQGRVAKNVTLGGDGL